MPSSFNVVLLGSGRGSNAEAVLAAQRAGRLGRAQVAGLLCDQPGARMLELGPRFGVPAVYLDPAPFKTKLEGAAEQRYIAQIRAWNADLVVLAGFMRVLKAEFLRAFAGRIHQPAPESAAGVSRPGGHQAGVRGAGAGDGLHRA